MKMLEDTGVRGRGFMLLVRAVLYSLFERIATDPITLF